jgi:membrane protease YdiL (CAAX protease family)
MNRIKRFLSAYNKQKKTKLTSRIMLYNVYISQLLLAMTGAGMIYVQKTRFSGLFQPFDWVFIIAYGVAFAALVFIVDVTITRWVPADILDDGGLNELLFGNLPVWHIAVLTMIIAVSEEVLFRGAIQSMIGAYWTSILFAAIHFRYLKHWLLTGLVFSISYGLGWLMSHTGTLWTPIVAHFVIDFTLACVIRFSNKKEGNT